LGVAGVGADVAVRLAAHLAMAQDDVAQAYP
jgi:hypothetical protein